VSKRDEKRQSAPRLPYQTVLPVRTTLQTRSRRQEEEQSAASSSQTAASAKNDGHPLETRHVQLHIATAPAVSTNAIHVLVVTLTVT